MGWMHDTLAYFREDPLHRSHHHGKLTFAMMYAFTENFVLPLSHDEVVHLKKPLVYKMPGDRWQQFANLRLMYAWMWTFPGKKLLFMGGEFAQTSEWNSAIALPWHLRDYPEHRGIEALVGDLNRLYVRDARLHRHEFDAAGFRWLDCDDAAHSVLAYLRIADGAPLAVVLNLTPVPREHYRLGLPRGGRWRELLNSDDASYGGTRTGAAGVWQADPTPAHSMPWSVQVTLPPLGALILAPE
jgi:1,4-alpha-glucan branching enzyme